MMHEQGLRKKHKILVSLFFLFVVFFICVALVVRVVNITKRSVYDGKHRFSLSVQSERGMRLLTVEPLSDSVSLLTLPGIKSNKDLFLSLNIIPDGTVITKVEKKQDQSVRAWFAAVLLDAKMNNVTFIDLLRMYFFLLSFPSRRVDEITLPLNNKNDSSERIISGLLQDHQMVKENRTIALVNATAVSGVGRLFEKILFQKGANVVSVTTGREVKEKSAIITREESYTALRIARLFPSSDRILSVTPHFNDGQIADIIVVLGKDVLDLYKK